MLVTAGSIMEASSELHLLYLKKLDEFRRELRTDAFTFMLEEHVGLIPGLRQNLFLPLRSIGAIVRSRWQTFQPSSELSMRWSYSLGAPQRVSFRDVCASRNSLPRGVRVTLD